MSMYENLTDNAFIFTYPVATIVQKIVKSGHGSQGATIEGPLVVRSGKRMCIPLFTDEDLATQYINALPSTDKKRPMWLKNSLELYNYLAVAKDADTQHVAFDPRFGTAQIHRTTIESVLVSLRPDIPKHIREELEGE